MLFFFFALYFSFDPLSSRQKVNFVWCWQANSLFYFYHFTRIEIVSIRERSYHFVQSSYKESYFVFPTRNHTFSALILLHMCSYISMANVELNIRISIKWISVCVNILVKIYELCVINDHENSGYKKLPCNCDFSVVWTSIGDQPIWAMW